MNNSNLKWDASHVPSQVSAWPSDSCFVYGKPKCSSRLVLGVLVALEVMDGLWRWKCPFASTRTKFFQVEVDDKSNHNFKLKHSESLTGRCSPHKSMYL